tara:strand:+ start:8219 stop:9079 length:861 start_codon:yes stop_codon:yes gene_type:complete
MKKLDIVNAIKEVLGEEKPGLWANIRAKKARGEKPAHKNSNAHKDAVKAGKKINTEGEESGEELKKGDRVMFKANDTVWNIVGTQGDTYRINQQGERNIGYQSKDWLHNMIATKKAFIPPNKPIDLKEEDFNNKGHIAARNLIGKLRATTFKEFNDDELEAFRKTIANAFDLKEGLWANINAKKKAGKKSSHGNSNAHKDAVKAGNKLKHETANPQDGKAAPYGSGYKKVKEGNGYYEGDLQSMSEKEGDKKDKEHQGSNYKWPMSKATKDRKKADKKANKKNGSR